MDRTKWDRWAPGAGVVGVALIVATFFLPAKSPPGVGDETSAFVAWYTENQDALLTNTFLSGLAFIALTWFFASLVYTLWNAQEQRLAIVVLAGAIMLGAAAVVATAITTLLAYGTAGTIDPATVKLLFMVGYTGFAFTWPLAIIALATAAATMRAQIMPAWYSLASLAAGLWFVVGGATYASDGFFSPTGAFGFIGFLAFLAWVLLTSGLLLMRESPAEAPRPATAAM